MIMKYIYSLWAGLLLTFALMGNVSASTFSIDWNPADSNGWYVLDDLINPKVIEAYMYADYNLNGESGSYMSYFDGVEAIWLFTIGGVEYGGTNLGWNPYSVPNSFTDGSWYGTFGDISTFYASLSGSWTSNFPVPLTPTPMTFSGTGFIILPDSVPIPPAVWLFGSGLIGLLGFRKNFRKG